MKTKINSPAFKIAYRYPQLGLQPQKDLRYTEVYANMVRRGIIPEIVNLDYIEGSEKDSLITFDTPAGKVEVLHLDKRKDFIHFVQILGYKGDPRQIPDSMGAITIIGLINWRNSNVSRDTLIITSNCGYSGISDYKLVEAFVPEINSEEKWIEKSKIIRTYHELTHFICRNMFIDNKEVIRDEIVADIIGIVKAIGRLDVNLLKLFLGLEGDTYRPGGRLQNYTVEGESIEEIASKAKIIIQDIAEEVKNMTLEPFELVEYIETKRIGIEKQ